MKIFRAWCWLWVCGFTLLFGEVLNAQDALKPWLTNSPAKPAPILPPQIIGRGNFQPLTLSDLQVTAEIMGHVATTTYEMTFYNPNAAVLEGEFIFPLGEAQNIAAVALDINGKMRAGVIVEKQKARQTFEAVIRQKVDPLLVEKIAGNQFKTRIYPFNPQSTRRIRITLEEPLAKQNGAWVYRLPLYFAQKIAKFALTLEVAGATSAPAPVITSNLRDLAFTAQNQLWRATFKATDYELNTEISFNLPPNSTPSIFTHRQGAQTYFYTNVDFAANVAEKTLPQKIAIIWDTSLSGAHRDFAAERALLKAYLQKIGNAEIELITFNLNPTTRQTVKIIDGDVTPLFAILDAIVYDGGTRFTDLDLAKITADEILLFTDGVSTYGKTRLTPPPLAAKLPVYVINSARTYDRGHLAQIAQTSGGALINLKNETPATAINKLTKKPLRVLGYQISGVATEIYPAVGAEVSDDLTIAGIVNGDAAEIEIQCGYAPTEITQTRKIKISGGGDNSAVVRLWAAQKIRALEMDATANKAEILALGQQFSLVTENTSLLVLDDVADYVRYNIEPPAELRDEYNNLQARKNKEIDAQQTNAIADAIRQADVVKEWWKQKFETTPPPASYEKLKRHSSVDGLSSVATAPNAPMPRLTSNALNDAPLLPSAEIPMPASASIVGDYEIAFKDAVGEISFDEKVDGDSVASGKLRKSSLSASTAQINVKAWDPQTPYLKILQKSTAAELYADYLKLKTGYADQPSFYFDVADEFARRGQNAQSVVVLSNIVEMQLENVELWRLAANKLLALEKYAEAVELFQQIVEWRGEDPQTYRDLALAYQAAGENQKAFETFVHILKTNWARFNEIKSIVFVELNNLLALHPEIAVGDFSKDLIFPLPVDLRIVLAWSTDNTDIDLHVQDPHNENCNYNHRLTRLGGRYAFDFTDGFGPEEFMLKKALNGKYKIKTNNFGDRRQNLSGATTLYLDLYTHYGTPAQKHQRVLVRTENIKEDNVIGEIEFGGE